MKAFACDVADEATVTATMVAFITGPFGGYINGSALVMDGGLSAHLANDMPSF